MQNFSVRNPVVAGKFYPASEADIKKQIRSFNIKEGAKTDAIACMLPHAGYIYSGKTAAETASRINIRNTLILLGPNHTGLGAEYSLMTEGFWETPLGRVRINSTLAEKLLENSDMLKNDPLAHISEHSLEVELPILQYFKPSFTFVPITILSNNLAALKELGKTIAGSIKELKLEKSALIAASSDMTHYESEKDARAKDAQAIKAIISLDEDALMQKVTSLNISMCGYAPVIAMISAAKALGAKKAELADYSTSGDVTKDRSSVVGYAGIVVS